MTDTNALAREMCVLCDDETGCAGKDDDSFYVGEQGPFCEPCFDVVQQARIEALEEAAKAVCAKCAKGYYRQRRVSEGEAFWVHPEEEIDPRTGDYYLQQCMAEEVHKLIEKEQEK